MELEEALELTGAVICEFGPDEDECETCGEAQKQLYYIRTCYEVDEGEYHCEDCIKKKPEEWEDFGNGLVELHLEHLQEQKKNT